MWAWLKAFLRVYGAVLLVLAGVAYVALGYVAPPPPKTLRIAAGAEGGAYHAAALRYREMLAREGVDAEVLVTRGSLDNIALLERDEGNAHIAFVQGGVARATDHPELVGLASVFDEALWMFMRATAGPVRLAALRGRCVAVGAEGSGTRVLALALLAANGVGAADFVAVAAPGDAAAEPRCAGGVEAAFIVNARPTPLVQSLLRDPAMRLVDFAPRAEAYLAAFPYLSAAVLPAGGVSLAEDIPPAGAVLLAPAAQLVARADIHPKLVNLLMPMLPELHGVRQLFNPAGRYPSARQLDFPLHPDAERWFTRGPSLLQRWLPFWVAVWVERMLVLLIPLATLAIPLLRFAPPALRWQVERRIYRWYRNLRDLELRARAAATPAERAELRVALDGVEAAVAAIRVPAAYGRQLYDLRQHVAFLRGLLAEPPAQAADAPSPVAAAQARDD